MRNREIDAEGRETKFEYDSLGRRTKRILPGGQQETFAYDAVGSLINRTDFNGNTTTFAYDVMNRLLLETPDAAAFPGTAAITFTYTDNGQRATMSDANGLTTFTYDERDRLLTKATPDGTLTYTYDAAGNLLSTTSSNVNGVAVSYQYDVLNRLSAAGDENFTPPATHTYSYDDVGNLENLEYANGVTHFWSYDDRNRLENLVVTDVSDIAIASFNYALDLVGNRTQMAELSGRVVDYTYDKLYRLTDEVIGGGVGPTGAVNYQYDAVGNRLSRTSTLAGQTNQAFGYDNNDRILTDTFDANGNTIASGGNTDEYDFKNRLVRRTKTDGTTIDIIYDGDGNRVAKTVTPLGGPSVTTKYLVDTNNLTGFAQVFEEIENGTVVSVYTYALDLISIDQDVGGQFEISYYLYDGLGSVRSLTDLNSNLTDTYTYDAFGDPLTVTGLTPNNYRFTGEQFDSDLGLYFLRARYLNTQTGRFHTLDTFEGFNLDPANANPVSFTDPSGNFSLGEATAVSFIIAIINTTRRSIIRALQASANRINPFSKEHTHRNEFNKCPFKPPVSKKRGIQAFRREIGPILIEEGPIITVTGPLVDHIGNIWENDNFFTSSLFHGINNVSFRGTGNVKGSQCVYDSGGKIVLEGKFRGTFDYVSPVTKESKKDHFEIDVLPHILNSNYKSPDLTTVY